MANWRMSRSYDAAQIRRNLAKAIADLVQIGYLQAMPEEIQFLKKEGCRGLWDVTFQMGATHRKPLVKRSGGVRKGSIHQQRPEHRIFCNGQFEDELPRASNVLDMSKVLRKFAQKQ